MTGNSALKQIAKLRGCDVEESREFCLELQAVVCPNPSFKSIARAMQQLGSSATMEAMAEKATSIHKEELRQRSLGRRRSPTPKYIIVDGVVQDFRGWQRREGIIQDE